MWYREVAKSFARVLRAPRGFPRVLHNSSQEFCKSYQEFTERGLPRVLQSLALARVLQRDLPRVLQTGLPRLCKSFARVLPEFHDSFAAVSQEFHREFRQSFAIHLQEVCKGFTTVFLQEVCKIFFIEGFTKSYVRGLQQCVCVLCVCHVRVCCLRLSACVISTGV